MGRPPFKRAVSRKELKVDKFHEAKLLNFFSAAESFAGKDDDSGIFISRMYFKKAIPQK